MRGLLVLGCIALGVFLVTASPHDQAQPEVEAKDEGAQGEFVHIREIRSTGDNKKKGKTPRRTPGLFTALAKLPTTRLKRNTEQKRKKCPGCYSPLYDLEKNVKVLAKVSRQQRDADEHEKLKRKHKHLKEKSHMKRRKHKNHEDRHAHFQAEDAEIGHNNQKRRKHHRGKKDREQHRSGLFTNGRQAEDAEIGHNNQKRRKHHRGKKDREQHRSGLFTGLSQMPPNREKINMDTNGRQAEDAEIGHNNQKRRKHHRGKKDREQHRSGLFTGLIQLPPDREKINMDTDGRQRSHRREKDRSRFRAGSLTALGVAQPEMKMDNHDKQAITE